MGFISSSNINYDKLCIKLTVLDSVCTHMYYYSIKLRNYWKGRFINLSKSKIDT